MYKQLDSEGVADAQPDCATLIWPSRSVCKLVCVDLQKWRYFGDRWHLPRYSTHLGNPVTVVILLSWGLCFFKNFLLQGEVT